MKVNVRGCRIVGMILFISRNRFEVGSPECLIEGRSGSLKASAMNLDHHKIRAQLERLAASPEFARTDRMTRFLRFVVEKTLVKDTVALRERQIGIEVFDRPDDWDPKLDNIVRSEARRLRAKLDAYAETASPDETVRITMPKGGYAVEFLDLRPEREPDRPDGMDGEIAAQAARPLPLERRPFLGWRISLLLGALMVVTVTSVFVFSERQRRAVQAKNENFEIVPFSMEIGQQFSPSISPDGSKVAFVWNGDGTHFNIYHQTGRRRHTRPTDRRRNSGPASALVS